MLALGKIEKTHMYYDTSRQWLLYTKAGVGINWDGAQGHF